MTRTLVVGTRGSALARRQTEIVLDAIQRQHPGARFAVRVIRTTGDRRPGDSLPQLEKGAFVKELETALLAGEIDLAVHSLKDMPTLIPDGLTIAAVSRREDPLDALVSRDGLRLWDLPAGARVGTDSARRACQLRALRPDLEVAGIRGNIDTRIRKVEAGEYDAVLIAAAALARLGWGGRAAETLPDALMLPAPGQGALAVEVRADDEAARGLAQVVDDRDTRLATAAERAFLRRLGGGCRVPIAALGTIQGGRLHLKSLVGDADGSRIVRGEISGRAGQAEALGERLADRLLGNGAAALLEAGA